MKRDWLDKKAKLACGRSRCDDCPNIKGTNPYICNICMKSYVKGYKTGYRTKKTKR